MQRRRLGEPDSGSPTAVIKSRNALRDVADALRHVGEGYAQGETVIQIAEIKRRASRQPEARTSLVTQCGAYASASSHRLDAG